MSRLLHRRGQSNPLLVMGVVSMIILVVIGYLLFQRPRDDAGHVRLFMYCAAGMRKPLEKIARDYEEEFGVAIELQFGGSNTLLSQVQVADVGDLYLAADDSYTSMAVERKLAREEFPVAAMRPVIAVAPGNPENIRGIEDLLRDDVIVALGNPDQAAIGKRSRKLLTKSGHWSDLERRVTKSGVFKPTVPEVANDVKIGSADASIIWDAVCEQMQLDAVETPELNQGRADITVAVLESSDHPTEAIRFARYVASRDRGLKTFSEFGYQTIDGDVWAGRRPELTFFAGAVNRRALEPILSRFAKREGIELNTVYNGCGILTANMRTMLDQEQPEGFPDMYMACDVYYLETVAEHFQDAVNVSNADIVIAVQAGNPKNIETLEDLVKPGIRVAVGQPKQCTIGVLTKRLFDEKGLYEQLLKENVATQTTSSAQLIATLENVNAAIVYATDTQERRKAGKIDIVAIDSPLAKAVQPYSIARRSDHKFLARRLFQAITKSRDDFESAGFHWRLNGTPAENAADGSASNSQ